MSQIKYKLIKPSRGPYWIVRLDAPCGAGWQEKSTKQTRRREAERVAAQLVANIGETSARRITWKTFRVNYELEHLSKLKRPGCFKSAANKLELHVKPKYVTDLTAAKMKQFRQKMESSGMKSTTIASYLKHVRAALGWAAEYGYIDHAPRVRAGSTAKMKGRPITLEEFERMLAVTQKEVGKKRAEQFRRLLKGLWLTGLRLQEALDMRWSGENCIRPMKVDGQHPLLFFPGDQQKNGREQMVPILPEAAEFLRETPAKKRTGLVFPLQGARAPITTSDRASRIISAIGRRAGVITKIDPETNEVRHATAHDLRRSFATRLAKRVPADLLQEMMRHADIKTTKTHYAEIDAKHLSEQLQNALQ